MTGKLDIGREGTETMTMRRTGDVATDEQRVYLSEMYEGGMTVTEVAALHNVSKSSVSRSVNRAKKTLQDYLQFCL